MLLVLLLRITNRHVSKRCAKSTKNKRTPTEEASSTTTFSSHAPVALISIAASAIPGDVAPEEPVPRTVRLVKSAVS